MCGTAEASPRAEIIRIDEVGALVWSRTYSPPIGDATASAVASAGDGSGVFTGGYDGNVGLAKIDSAGAVIWARTYGPGTGFAVARANDGGFVIAGTEDPNGIACSDRLLVVKTDGM